MASTAAVVVEAVVFAGIDAAAARLVAVPFLPAVEREGFAFDADHLLDRQAVFLRKAEVALVVRRHRHHRALAVAHQHVVADPHRDRLAGERMGHLEAGVHALLFHRRHVGFGDAALLAFGDEGGERGIVLRRAGGERMLGGHRAEGHAHDGVGAGGEHPQLFVLAVQLIREGEAHADALADPVGLHGLHPLRPARQGVEAGQQLVGVLGDAEEVHRDVALFDQRAGAPAAPVDHLLVGEHGLVDRVPVDRGHLLVDHALFEQAGEQPLLPAVVVRLAGGELARPVDGEAQRLQLRAHVVDVGVGPGGGRHVVGDRGVFRRQAEGVPAHRLHHVEAAHGVVARQHVADGVVAHVAHVQLARRIGEHRQAVVFGAIGIVGSTVDLAGRPVRLRGAFDFRGKVFFLHCKKPHKIKAADYTCPLPRSGHTRA